LLPFLATKSNVASTLLLVWTGLAVGPSSVAAAAAATTALDDAIKVSHQMCSSCSRQCYNSYDRVDMTE